MKLFACANILGNNDYPRLYGNANFYKDSVNGIWIEVEVAGLPDSSSPNHSAFFALHIHENGNCTPPFDKTGEHYNPSKLRHPFHAGDLPPLLSNNGYAFMLIYTTRLSSQDVLDKSLVIHSDKDDFTSQPSGNSGFKIGCGVIKKCLPDNQYVSQRYPVENQSG